MQTHPGPIGSTLKTLRAALDPWLGPARYESKRDGHRLTYRMTAEGPTPRPMRLKIEINSREHFAVYGFAQELFEVRSRWFSGEASIATYDLEELLGTKVRALYQRTKGRDLFDLWFALEHRSVSPERIVEAFLRYMEQGGQRVTRAEFEANLDAKSRDSSFAADVPPLLAHHAGWDPRVAIEVVHREIVSRLPGEPWKGRG